MKRKCSDLTGNACNPALFNSFESLLEDEEEGVLPVLCLDKLAKHDSVSSDDTDVVDKYLLEHGLSEMVADEQLICQDNTLPIKPLQGDFEEMELSRWDMLSAKETSWVHENYPSIINALHKYGHLSCLFLKDTPFDHSACSLDFDHFWECFKQCIGRKRVVQAAMAIELFIEHGTAPTALTVERRSDLLELVFRANLDPDCHELLGNLVSLFAFCFKDNVNVDLNTVRLVVDKMRPVFSGYPFRAIACGNFLSLCSHSVACLFYDVLLEGKQIDSISDSFNSQLTVNFNDNTNDFIERLLFLSSRIACTSELQDHDTFMLKAIRQFKSRLPRGISSSTINVIQSVLTRVYGFIVANQQRRAVL